jgi:catechol 2,3-dioxygenase-like lactoylglutathione lyase family enzyme
MDLTSCHVELRVRDLPAARRFYVEQLGLAVLQETPALGLLALRAGGMRLSIFGDAATPVGAASVHLVLATPDLERTVHELAARGIDVDGMIEAPGFCRYVQTHDPEGHLVEIAQYLRDPLAPV